jgi:hypothetical protein
LLQIKLKYLLYFLLLNIISVQVGFTQNFKNEEERRKYAEKLFSDKKYIEASSHFLHFLSLEPNDYELNFKYGTCVIYTESDKTKALKYLQYSVKSPTIDPLAYYYLAKAYQISFRFSSAMKQFEIFKIMAPKLVSKYNVESEIRSCANGKELLKNFSEIIVLSKKQASLDKIQYSYDLAGMGGKLIVTEQFQSKIDKKNGHRAMVFFPDDPQGKIIYSSYGEVENNGLDLYMITKLPGGGLSEPQKLPDNINTFLDDDYGFLHPDGKTFYFSSKGHNSMGGYDIFKSEYNSRNNTFSRPINVDFKINTPADDILYIVDATGDYAYFSSNRASKGGYYDVYHIRNKTIPFNNVYIAGAFKNRIADNLAITIKVEDERSNLIGVYNSQSATGAYMLKLPKTGIFSYYVEVEGNPKLYAAKVEVPPSSSMMIKQELLLERIDGDEILVVRNLFDEPLENSEELLANVFMQISDLKENAELFDESLFEGEMTDDIFAELGVNISNATDQELLKVVNEIISKTRANTKKKEDLIKRAYEVADEKSLEADNLRDLSDQLLEKANLEEDEVKRRSYQNEANEARIKAKIASQQAYLAIEYAKEIEKSLEVSKSNEQKNQNLADDVRADIESNNKDLAVNKLRTMQQVAKQVEDATNSVSDISKIIDKRVEESQEDIKTMENRLKKAEESKQLAKDELADLEKQKTTAKKSQQELIQRQIEDTEEFLQTSEKQVAQIKRDVDFAKKQIELMKSQEDDLQNTFADSESATTKTYTPQEQTIIASRTEKVVKETKDVVVDNLPKKETKATDASILKEKRYVELENNIAKTNSITDKKEQLISKKALNETYVKTINEDIKSIEQKIAKAQGTEKSSLEKNLAELKSTKFNKEKELKQQNSELLALAEKDINATISTDTYAQLDEQLKTTANTEKLTAQTLSKLKDINTNYISTIDKDIAALNVKSVNAESDIEKAAAQKKINELQNKKTQKQKEQDELSVLADLDNTFSTKKYQEISKNIASVTGKDEEAITQKSDFINTAIKQTDADIFVLDDRINNAESEIVKNALKSKKSEIISVRKSFEEELVNINQQVVSNTSKPKENKAEDLVSVSTYEKLKNEYKSAELLKTEDEKALKKYEINQQYIATLDKDLQALKQRADNEKDEALRIDIANKAQQLINERNQKVNENTSLEKNKYISVNNAIKQSDVKYKTLNEKLTETNAITDDFEKYQQQYNINKQWLKVIEDEKTSLKKELSLANSDKEKEIIQRRLTELEKQDKQRNEALTSNQKLLVEETAKKTIADIKGDKKYETTIQKINEIEQQTFATEEAKLIAKKQAQTEYLNQIRKDAAVLDKSAQVIEDAALRTELLNELDRLSKKEIDIQNKITDADTALALAKKSTTEIKKEQTQTTKPDDKQTTDTQVVEETKKEETKTTPKETTTVATEEVEPSIIKPTYKSTESQKLIAATTALEKKLEELKKKELTLKEKAEQEGAESKVAKEYQSVKEQRVVAENELINSYKEPNIKEMDFVKNEMQTTKQALNEFDVPEDKLEEAALVERNAEKLFAHAKNLRYQATISPTNEVANVKLSKAYQEELQAIEEMNKAKAMYESIAKDSGLKPKQLAMGKDMAQGNTDVAFIAKNTEFKSEKAKQELVKSQELINEISALEQRIQELEKSLDKSKKQQKEISQLSTQKTEKEIVLAKEISKVNDIEIASTKQDKIVVKNDLNSIKIVDDLVPFKVEAEKEEVSIERLLEEANQLEKRAETTKDINEKNELYRQANIKKSIAILRQNDVLDAYNKLVVDNILIEREEAKVSDNHDVSNQQYDLAESIRKEADKLYQTAQKVKDSLERKSVSTTEINYTVEQLKKQADTKVQISEMVENNAEELKSLEYNLILQTKRFKELTAKQVDDVKSDKTYQNYYELNKEKEVKKSELNQQIIELSKEELRQKSLVNKGEQYEYEANVTTNSDMKSELLQKAAEVKEEAQLAESNISSLEDRINELMNEIQALENSIAVNFNRIQQSQQEKIIAVYAKAEDNRPLDKSLLAQKAKETTPRVEEPKKEITKTESVVKVETPKEEKQVVKTETKKQEEVVKTEKTINNNQSTIINNKYNPVDVKTFTTPTKIDAPIFTKTDNKAAYSEKTPIPINTASVEGLVYRVQIGAFSKPVPDNVFKGFAPISGEQVGGTGLVRYMAGYFSQFTPANSAKNDIRQIPGYSDAFVVAFYNGKKITIAEARQLEEKGVKSTEFADNKIDTPISTTEKTDTKTEKQVEETPTNIYGINRDKEKETQEVTKEKTETTKDGVTNFNQVQDAEIKNFSVGRTVAQNKGGVLVRIAFKNGTPTSNTQVIEQMPNGFRVEVLTKSGAEFTQQGTTLIFDWNTFNPDATEITYVLYPQSGVTNQRYEINGVFKTAKGDEIVIKPTGYFEYKQAPSVAETTTVKEPTKEVKPVTQDTLKASYYKDIKGAAKAEQVEIIKGLFFTVQVGVYSKPVSASALFNISPLNTELLKNGTIRYTTSRLKSVDEAIVRKDEIRLLGVSDAFVTAYYNGERITIAEAKKLLEEFGKDILAK